MITHKPYVRHRHSLECSCISVPSTLFNFSFILSFFIDSVIILWHRNTLIFLRIPMPDKVIAQIY